jgi:hypothetical protein
LSACGVTGAKESQNCAYNPQRSRHLSPFSGTLCHTIISSTKHHLQSSPGSIDRMIA